MLLPKIKRYQKKFEYSYAFGAYPVLDLLKFKKENVLKILFKNETQVGEGIKEIIDICEESNIPFEYAPRSIEKIAVKENTYVVGIFKKYVSELERGKDHLLLVNPSNLGNMGTVIRTMLGFNLTNLAIIKPAGDIFDPSVVRSTMGALFQINFEYFENISEYTKKYSENNLYPFMLDGAIDIRETVFKTPFTIIQGNESTGLDSSYKDIGESVYIPHSDKIDSLNLSVATSISLWEVFRGKKSKKKL